MNRYELVSKFKYRNMFNFECSTHWPPIRSYNGNCWTILAFSSANANSVRKLPHSLHFWNVLIFRMRIYLIAFLSHDRFETVWLRRMHRQRSELSCTTKHGVVECNKFTHFMILMHRRHSPKRISCSNLSSIFFLATAAAAVHLISLFDARSKWTKKNPKNSIVTRKINFLFDFRVLLQLLLTTTTMTTTSSVTFAHTYKHTYLVC